MFSVPELFIIGVTYLAFLFGTAYLTEKGALPARLVRHPLTHVLSIGVYASVWTFYGAFALASESGYTFLASYLGAVATFILGPALLIPILRIARTYQLNSLADLLAFRFRSASIGVLTTLFTVLATLPMISIQIQAVADAVHILNGRFSADQIALVFCSVLALFAILFGARHASPRTQHSGLVVAMAVESVIKLVALSAIGIYAFWYILGGPADLSSWLASNPAIQQTLNTPMDSGTWRTLLLSFFTAAIVMPHMFHLMFTENAADETIYKATWAMPLYLLILALAVPPILWAAHSLGAGGDAQFTMLYLGLQLDSEWLAILAFIGGLSAASGIMIVASVSMASMLQNHIILPLIPRPGTTRFYAWLLWLRRILIVALLFTSYLFYRLIGSGYDLHLLGIIAVVAFLQFLPALLVTLFWPRANRWGLITGMLLGMGVWLGTMLSPLLLGITQEPFQLEQSDWDQTAVLSLMLNALSLVAISLLVDQTPDEERAASACLLNALQRPVTQSLRTNRVEDFQKLLRPRLGREAAQREVQSAMDTLGMDQALLRPVDLLRLRNQLEHNLSGLLGPIEAASLLEPLDHPVDPVGFKARDVHLMEDQLETYQVRMTGLAAELDELRRYHRLTLQKLPVGVCTLDSDRGILLWNAEMEHFTGLCSADATGTTLADLPEPWGTLLGEFAEANYDHEPGTQITVAGQPRWFGLHKAQLTEKRESGMVLLLEDETEPLLLQNRLAHSERLASIGRFAAGVAHEIGNPVTGIACLAQNLKLETDNEYILETGDQIVDQTKRISRIVQSLVRFARTGTVDLQTAQEPVSLHQCIEEAVHLVSLDSRGKYQQYLNRVQEDLVVIGDTQQLLQVFVNLLNNASDASEESGRIWVEALSNGETVVINITDEGSGIPAELQDRLFEPFFTTKDPGKGTGLGLPLVYNIIQEHYGSIEIFSPAKNKQNKGTQVVITLPRLSPGDGSDMGTPDIGRTV
ncbi:sensor histidine kinase [Marinobacterium jannaschii]|uniref:sensor histidine kinase n=1 Tax=Marinobacterium jannaschii TaxID=64970 RepID=UPI0004847E73|nr:sensor histidine kinase [Marinobacterium jannaschii]